MREAPIARNRDRNVHDAGHPSDPRIFVFAAKIWLVKKNPPASTRERATALFSANMLLATNTGTCEN